LKRHNLTKSPIPAGGGDVHTIMDRLVVPFTQPPKRPSPLKSYPLVARYLSLKDAPLTEFGFIGTTVFGDKYGVILSK